MIKLFSTVTTSSVLVLSCVIPVAAQVIPDGTTSTTVDVDGTINNGDRAGGNLFHSFSEFSVPTGGQAFFNNSVDVVNIFSRVTGGNLSNIDGLLRANGTANLFLINPAGILFGENARLDIGGSFFGSTADSIIFSDGEFSALDADNPPLLTINAPLGLGIRDNPADITVRGDGNGARLEGSEVIDTQNALRVDSEATIGLVGGNLIFEDATIKTAGGRIELGSVAGGQVNLNSVDNGFTLDYSAIETFRDITLSGSSNIDASGLGGGDIQVVGRNISLTNISGIEANTLGSIPGGDINISASESLNMSGVENEDAFVSGITTRIFPQGTADGGDINIETGSLNIGDRALISTSVLGQGNAGDVNINATEGISLVSEGNTSAIVSNVGSDAVGNGGDINITTPSLTLSDGAFLSSNTSGEGNAGNISIITSSLNLNNGSFFNANTGGQGNAGNITVNSTGTISLDDSGTGFFTNVFNSETIGNGGNIDITANSLNLSNGTFLNANTSGQGNAGNITVNANESISIEGQDTNIGNTGILSLANATATGNAGNIDVTTGSLTLNNGATLATASFSLNQTSAGNMTINASDAISFSNGSAIFVSGANEGSLAINAKSLELTSGSNFFAGIGIDSGSTDAQAGDIIINLTEDLTLDGIGSTNTTTITNTSFGTGNAGNIFINVRNINFRNGGNILNSNSGDGNLGDINIIATGDVFLDGSTQNPFTSNISNFVTEGATGDVGKVDITAQNLTIINGALVQSSVAGNANAGDVNINIVDTITIDGSGENTILEDGTITAIASGITSEVANTANGNSGDININTQNLFLSRNGKVSASMFGTGSGGDININADVITIGEQGNTVISPSSISSEAISGFFNNPTLDANAGNITIDTRSLSISDGGDIDVGVNGIGNGGNITINAAESISIDGTGIINDIEIASDISSNIAAGASGNAGDLIINTPNLSVRNNAFISSDVFASGTGNSGNIEINTTDLSVNNGSYISSDILGTGNSGNIEINTTNLSLVDNGLISASIFEGGQGTAGSLAINATGSVELLAGGDIQADIFENAIGSGGNLFLQAENLTLTDGSQIGASTFSEGNAGSVTISVNDTIELIGQSEFGRSGIFASALVGSGNGGDLNVFTDNLIFRDGATITASNFQSLGLSQPGSGNSGNVNINAEAIVAFPNQNNDIVANARQGNGGNINITADAILGITERPNDDVSNDIDASSQATGSDGVVTINNPDINPLQGVNRLPTNPVSADTIATDACSATGGETNLIIKGKGGIPPEPNTPLPAESLIPDGQPIALENETETDLTSLVGNLEQNQENPHYIPAYIKPIQTDNGDLYPARGIVKTADGKIILTAYPNPDTTIRNLEKSLGCS